MCINMINSVKDWNLKGEFRLCARKANYPSSVVVSVCRKPIRLKGAGDQSLSAHIYKHILWYCLFGVRQTMVDIAKFGSDFIPIYGPMLWPNDTTMWREKWLVIERGHSRFSTRTCCVCMCVCARPL